jgi:hypothetical protein
VLQSLIETIRVDARDHIEPTFRVPAVRVDYDYMEPTGIEPVTSCLQIESGRPALAAEIGLPTPDSRRLGGSAVAPGFTSTRLDSIGLRATVTD